MSALPLEHLEEPLEPQLREGLKRLKLRRLRHLAPQLCLTARTQRWRPEELLRVLARSSGCSCRSRSAGTARVSACTWPLTSAHHCSAQPLASASEVKPSGGRLALTNLTNASTLPFVSASFGAAVAGIEAVVTAQAHQLRVEHRRRQRRSRR
jgi:hypothetical protein